MFSRRLVMASALATLAAGGAARAQGGPPDVVRIPVRQNFGRLWTVVRINGGEPVRFMIDTGADGYVVDAGVAQQLGLKPSLPAEVAGVVSSKGVRGFWTPKIVIGDAFADQDVYMFGADFEDFIKGALPGWLLQAYKSELDFQAGELRLYPSGGPDLTGYEAVKLIHRERVGAVGGGALQPKRIRDPQMLINVELDGHTLRVVLDTGAPSILTLFPYANRGLGLWKQDGARDVGGAGVSGAYRGRQVRADSLKIGGSEIKAPVVTLVDPTRTNYMDVDGLLGLDALRRFNLSIDAAGGKLWLKPNGAFNMAQRIDRSGLEGYSRQGKIHVEGVVAGSAAEKAGLKAGDVIDPPGGTAAFWWSLEGAPGEVIEFTTQRDGQAAPTRLVLKDVV